MIPLLEQIKDLFFIEWDPIGINEHEEARDEYDDYAFNVYVLIQQGTNTQEISEYLNFVQGELMGMSLNEAQQHHRRKGDGSSSEKAVMA